MCFSAHAVFTPVFLAVGSQLIGETAEYRLIGISQTWLSVHAAVYLVALVFQRRRRQRTRWTDVVKYNTEDLWLTVEDTGNRAEWRRRTRVADRSPEGLTA